CFLIFFSITTFYLLSNYFFFYYNFFFFFFFFFFLIEIQINGKNEWKRVDFFFLLFRNISNNLFFLYFLNTASMGGKRPKCLVRLAFFFGSNRSFVLIEMGEYGIYNISFFLFFLGAGSKWAVCVVFSF